MYTFGITYTRPNNDVDFHISNDMKIISTMDISILHESIFAMYQNNGGKHDNVIMIMNSHDLNIINMLIDCFVKDYTYNDNLPLMIYSLTQKMKRYIDDGFYIVCMS
jgi:hypothetical protein